MGLETGSRPKKPYEQLGADVQVTTEKLENDDWAQQTLKEIGKSMTESGFEHVGSAAIHFYQSKNMLTLTTRDAQIKHQLALGDLSEQLTQFGAVEFIKRLQAHYRGREQRSVDPRYKVEG